MNPLRRKRANGKRQTIQPLAAVPYASGSVFDVPDMRTFYDPVMLNPSTIAATATLPESVREMLEILKRLEPDDYIRYVVAFCERGLARYGDAWRYADLTTVLLASAKLLRPRTYLEIGVRRGRSMAMMAAVHPSCAMIGFDTWESNYAGMQNPGPELVCAELQRIGHTGPLELISGDSHVALPAYFAHHSDRFFDVITVDGDHSEIGAEQDLRDALPRLTVGGIVIFDDICSPIHPYLGTVWRRVVANDERYLCWEFTELGYGVAFAVRRQA